MIVYDACRLIRERMPDAASGQREYLVQCSMEWNEYEVFFV